jgi:DNA-binding SARP family transcriptional activator/streptogramin lyase
MEFRILGPIEVVDRGRTVAIRRGKEQALLVYLLLHANQVVASDRLVDELWGERPPPTAVKILQNAVSQLRKALGDDRLVTRPPGYVLRVEPGELDLERFESLAEQGRANGDGNLLREALGLWRGEPLAELRDEPFARDAARRLDQARLGAREDRIESDLAEGRHVELIPELEGLIAKHPYDERLHGQLMLALYRAGRPKDALDVYQRARKTFDSELGLQPGSELEQLQRRILNQDADLAAPRRKTAGLSGRGATRRRRVITLLVALVAAAAVTLALVLANLGSGAPTVVKDSLVKLDPDTGEVLDVTRVGGQPISVGVVGDTVWTGSIDDSTLTSVDLKSGHVGTVGGIRTPIDVAADGARHLWFSTYGYDQVTRIDTRTRRADVVVPVRNKTFLLGVGAGSLWVSEHPNNLGEKGTVAQIDLATAHVRRTYRVGVFPADVKVGLGAAWVTNGGDASVSRINLDDGSVERISVGNSPGSLAIAFGSIWLIAGDRQDTIWRLNPQTRQADAVIKVGKLPFDVVAAAHAVWVTRREAGTVVRIDPRTNTVTKTIHLGFKPQGMTVGADALWVTVGHGELGPLG